MRWGSFMKKSTTKSKTKSNGRSLNGHKPRRSKGLSNRIDLVRQADEVERIFKRAVEHELSIHKRLGNPVAVWRNGKVTIIPPEEITLSSKR